MVKEFDTLRSNLETQFQTPDWIWSSGLDTEALEAKLPEIEAAFSSKAIIKAEVFALIAREAMLAVDKEDIFQDKLAGKGILRRQRVRWEKDVKGRCMPEEEAQNRSAWSEYGLYKANSDYSHTSPNTRLMLAVGFPGLLHRVEKAAAKPGLTQKQQDFYRSCTIVLEAIILAAKRLAHAVKPYNEDNSKALMRIATGAPETIYDAMQLLVLYFFFHDYIGGTRVRTLGRLDVLLYPFYKKDLENGTYTKADIKEMLKFFLHKFWSAKVPYDLPFCLGGMDQQGHDVTNELSYLIVETYNELDIYSPKIHIRVTDGTPADFVKLVLACIRGGNSGFVFINDAIAIRGLLGVGIEEKDVWDYVPIGCYEPAVWGMELGCTGCGGINLAKAVELVFTNGYDLASGVRCGLQTGTIDSYPRFLAAVKEQIAYLTEQATGYVVKSEGYYGDINPDPLLSCQYDRSVETGIDVYEGGAKYNNSSMAFYSIASVTDAICAVKKLVFDSKIFTFDQLGQMLRCNWEGYEKARAAARKLPEKYGNHNETADTVAAELAHFCASLVNNKPNGRGGVFKASIYTIDHCFKTGLKTMATPDGRLAGQPLSKNLCAVTGMDKKGITALIHSVTKLDMTEFPNGSVLDVVLHPSAIAGEDGLTAFYSILLTYFKKGGFALHGNVFRAEDLKKAQTDPEKYKNLQVRVCGWNAYFVNLSKEEQDAFILQAENIG